MGQSRRFHQGRLLRLLGLATLSGALFVITSSVGTPVATAASSSQLNGMSCPSTSFCVAIDQAGDAFTFDGSAWSSPVLVDSAGLISVSCPSPSFCAAVGAGDVSTFDGSSWSTPVTIDTSSLYPFGSVSCTSSSFCMAVDQLGESFMFDGSSWTPVAMSGYQANFAVSCASSTFCVSVGVGPASCCGYVVPAASVYNGLSWTSVNPASGLGSLDSVSCVSTSDCVAMGVIGEMPVSRREYDVVATFDGSSWTYSSLHAPRRFGDDRADVSCVGPSFCLATNLAGNESSAILFDGTRWKAVPNPPLDQISTEACATTTFCVAGDQQGQVSVLSRRAKTWVWSSPVDA